MSSLHWIHQNHFPAKLPLKVKAWEPFSFSKEFLINGKETEKLFLSTLIVL